MTSQNQGYSNGNLIRYAVVGLSWIAQEVVLPGFAKTKNSQIVAFVSDDPTKR